MSVACRLCEIIDYWTVRGGGLYDQATGLLHDRLWGDRALTSQHRARVRHVPVSELLCEGRSGEE